MANQYGPWATLMNAGGSPQLSTFWKRRMTRLVSASETSPVLSRRNLLWLGAAGAVTSMVPTVRLATVMAEEAKTADTEQKASSGRIFVAAVWRTGKGGPENDKGGVIAIDPETAQWEKIIDGVGAVRVSPDGKFLAHYKLLSIGSLSRRVPTDIWAYDLSTGRQASMGKEIGVVTWSPDATEIIVSRSRMDRKDEKSPGATWRVARDGSKRTRMPIPETDEVDDWSRDGAWLVTVSDRHETSSVGYQLYRMRPDGSRALRLTQEGRNVHPRFSPDSRRIVYSRDYWMSKSDAHELHVMDVGGGNDHVVLRSEGLEDFEEACWSPDGRRLAVIWTTWQMKDGQKVRRVGEPSRFRIEIMDADGTNRRELKLPNATMLQLFDPDWR